MTVLADIPLSGSSRETKAKMIWWVSSVVFCHQPGNKNTAKEPTF